MGDAKSTEFRKAQYERRELVQLAVEEMIKRDGRLPSSVEVSAELGLDCDNHTIRRDWDWLHEQGRLPERPNRKLQRKEKRNVGAQGGALFLEIEILLRRITGEIDSSSPEYRRVAQEFWITRLDIIRDLADKAMESAVGSSVDELIGKINEKGR